MLDSRRPSVEILYVPLLDKEVRKAFSVKGQVVQPTDTVISIKGEEEKFDAIIDTGELKQPPLDRAIYHPETTHIKLSDTEVSLSEIEQLADEAISLFPTEFHWTPGFVISLITSLGSMAGALALSIIENRWDGPFFAAACAGAAMVIMGGVSAVGFGLVCYDRDCAPLLVVALIGTFMYVVQNEITSYYRSAIEPSTPIDPGNPAGYAEGTGALGLVALISFFSTFYFYRKSLWRETLFSNAEEKLISSAQTELASSDVEEKMFARRNHLKIGHIVRTNDPIDYLPRVLPWLKAKKRELSLERRIIATYQGALFSVLQRDIALLSFEYAYKPPEGLSQVVKRFREQRQDRNDRVARLA